MTDFSAAPTPIEPPEPWRNGPILAIDTSGPAGTVALARPDGPREERRFDLHTKHAQVLLPGIRDLLRESGLAARDLGLVAVSVGPGSFTGLRVGVMCAKTLAYATGARLAAIGTLAAIARGVFGAAPLPCGVWVVENAQRGDLFALRLPAGSIPRGDNGPGVVLSPTALRDQFQPGDLVIGPGVEGVSDLPRPETHAEGVVRPTGEALVELGRDLAERGRYADPWSLEPVYLRRSAAEDQWLARQGASG